jgi:signal transduction histidine kinase
MKFRSRYRNPTIRIGTEKSEDGYLILKVSDNGLGIKTEDKDKIFNMYFRGNEQIKGTGVGMAIVKRMVDNADGKIEVDSALGKGSTFKIFLPINEGKS